MICTTTLGTFLGQCAISHCSLESSRDVLKILMLNPYPRTIRLPKGGTQTLAVCKAPQREHVHGLGIIASAARYSHQKPRPHLDGVPMSHPPGAWPSTNCIVKLTACFLQLPASSQHQTNTQKPFHSSITPSVHAHLRERLHDSLSLPPSLSFRSIPTTE